MLREIVGNERPAKGRKEPSQDKKEERKWKKAVAGQSNKSSGQRGRKKMEARNIVLVRTLAARCRARAVTQLSGYKLR